VSGSGISWAIGKSAPRFRQITTPAPHYSSFFLQTGCPSCRPTNGVKALKAKGRNMPAISRHTFFLSETAGAQILGFENRIMSLDIDSKQENQKIGCPVVVAKFITDPCGFTAVIIGGGAGGRGGTGPQ